MSRPLRTLSTAAIAAFAITAATIVGASPAAAAIGVISGTVSTDTNSVLRDVVVDAFDPNGNFAAHAVTDEHGQYALSVPPGTYTVQFRTWGLGSRTYVGEWYGDSLFESGAQPITVNADDFINGDVQLASGGTISGSITGPSPGYASAQAFAFDPVTATWQVVGNPSTAGGPPATTYTVSGLSPAVQYRVRFSQVCEGEGCIQVAPEWYSNAISVGSATSVSVSVGATTAGINGTLGSSSSIPVSRIAGADRFETSALIAQQYDPADVDLVYVASGLNFPDALSAAPAAAHREVPLLLTATAFLPPVIASELERLDPARVIIVGGEPSVSAAVQDAIATALPGAAVERIGGSDRFETSRLITTEAFASADEVWISTGLNFADALAAAPVAGHNGSPVLLVNGGAPAVDAGTAALLDALGTTSVKITGDANSVSAGIESSVVALPAIAEVERLDGSDRYQTAARINMFRWPMVDEVYLAVGTGFPDALSGAALAGRDGKPMYLVPGPCVTKPVRWAIWNLTPERLIVLGGPTTISPAAASLTPC